MAEHRGTDLRDRPTSELLKQLSDQSTTLVRQEIELAKLEVREKGKKAGLGAGMFGGAGLFGLYAVGALTATIILALATFLPGWVAALIVTVDLRRDRGHPRPTGQVPGEGGHAAHARAGGRDDEGGRAMGQDPSQVGTTGAAVSATRRRPRTPRALRAEIERTRLDLGDTVAALAEKTDVKARAKEKVADVRHTVNDKRERAHGQRARVEPDGAEIRGRAGPGQGAGEPRPDGGDRRARRRLPAGPDHEAPLSAAPQTSIEDESHGRRPPHRHRHRHDRTDSERTATDADATATTDHRRFDRDADDDDATAHDAHRRRGPRARRHQRHAEVVVRGVLKRAIRRVPGGQRHRLGGRADVLRRAVDLPDAARARSRCSGSSASRRRSRSSTTCSSIAPGPAKDILTQAITNLQKSQGAAGVVFFVGLAVAMWSASGYVGAFMRASNAIWDVEEGRPAWKTIPLRLAVTALLLVLLTAERDGRRAHRAAGEAHRRHRRARQHRGDGLGHRQVAGARLRREPDDRAALLRVAEREAPEVPVGEPRQPARRACSGSPRRRCSRSTSRTSARTTRPTARSAA